jgi:hypothetical protein
VGRAPGSGRRGPGAWKDVGIPGVEHGEMTDLPS